MKKINLFCCIGLSVFLTACQTSEHYSNLHGPELSLSDYGALEKTKGDAKSSSNEEYILKEYAKRAGLTLQGDSLPSPISDDWQLIVRGGLNSIDEQCGSYMGAMFWADREMRTARDNINLVGATTGTLMGVFGGPAAAIATTAAAFGLATQTITNESKGLFFDIEPSGVRRIVSRSQAAYREGVEGRITTYNSRPAAVAAIQGYLTLCLPDHIATQINESIDSSKFQVADRNSPNPNPQPVVVQKKADEQEIQREESDNLKWGPNKTLLTDRPPTKPLFCDGQIECNMTEKSVFNIQNALCIKNASRVFDSNTRNAIAFFRASNVLRNARYTGGLKFDEADLLNKVSSCNSLSFLNAFERFYLGVDKTYDSEDLEKITKLVNDLESIGISFDGDIDRQELRKAISKFQNKKGLSQTGEITPQFLQILNKEVAGN